MNKKIVIIGMILIVIAVILGAFGAHALKERLPIEKLTSFEAGVRYQMYNGIALLVLGFNVDKMNFSLKWPFRILIIGVLFFSVSIYFLAIQPLLGVSLKFFGPVTPFGGVLMITAWMIIIFRLLNDRQISS